ncbi:MAG: ATP-binding protein [Pseudomonadota bacterium]
MAIHHDAELHPRPSSDPATTALAAAFIAAASASLAYGLGAPSVSAVFALAGLVGGAVALVLSFRSAPRALVEGGDAVAITDLTGTVETASDAFTAVLKRRGLRPDFAGLTSDTPSAASLFALRRAAITDGFAEGVLPNGVLVRVRASHGRLVHHVSFGEVSEAADLADTSAQISAHASADAIARSVVDIFPAPAAVVSETGAMAAANDAFRAMVGDVPALSDGILLEDDGLARLSAQTVNGATGRLEATLKARSDRRIRLTAKPFAGGQLLVAVADVTEQSELEAQMAQSQKMQAIGQLAGGIAHDFNNVLTAIIGFSDLLLQNHRPSDPAFRDILNIKQSAQRAAGLVKQLLAFSRRQTLRPTILNLNDVISDLSVMLDRLLGEPIHLEITHGRDLWPVMADLSQIEQVVINLSVNARDAMKGGGTLTIRTFNAPHGANAQDEDALEGDAVVIEIEDVGTGMPQHVLEKIFEPFFTTKATGEGTGLGLSTVYGIVKQTGGTLAVSSEEGLGATFRVYLPRAIVAAKAQPEPPREAPTVTDLTGSATLLLVEDEEAIRTFAARALSAKGYTVLSAGSGVEAAEIFDERGPDIDLLLTDVIMPELDGPSLVKHVRAIRPELKVIFMSGYADGASVDDLGGAQFLPKPFTLKALAEAVKKELSAG